MMSQALFKIGYFTDKKQIQIVGWIGNGKYVKQKLMKKELFLVKKRTKMEKSDKDTTRVAHSNLVMLVMS